MASDLGTWNFELKISLIGLVVLGSGLGIYLVRTYEFRTSRKYPNLLEQELLTSGRALEKDGIQFNAHVVPAADGWPRWLEVFLQNCFDEPRHVRIRFEASNPLPPPRLHPGEEIDLAGAEVVSLRFPMVSPKIGAPYDIFMQVDIAGSGGSRVRRWKGKLVEDRVERSKALQAAADGTRLEGAGLRFTLGPICSANPKGPLPEVQVTSIWKPGGSHEGDPATATS